MSALMHTKDKYFIRMFFTHKGKTSIDYIRLNNCEKDIEFRWKCANENLSPSFRLELFYADNSGKWNLLKTTSNEQYRLF